MADHPAPRPSAPADPPGPAPSARTVGPALAVALVFGSSAAVLVIELVALRLLAPYLGLTLETNTLVIGIALCAIALGSWAGGRAADATDPRLLLAPCLGIAGAVAALTPATVRTAGAAGDGSLLLLAAAATIIVPGALLAAVTPIVTKLRLTDLASTGSVVGRLSGIGTAGSIVGTVLTGFVLVSRVAVSAILVGLGVVLVVAALGVALHLHRRSIGRGVTVSAMVVGLGAVAASASPGGCDAETTYHCASVVVDPDRESGRTLVLDGVNHSYVDLDDPAHLEFAYVQGMAAVIDAAFAPGEPLEAYHLGAGGLTLPRYLDAERPGTTGVVSEIDGGVVRLDRELLGEDVWADLDDGLEVRVEDGRRGLERMTSGRFDLVVGDAFGGVSVPWHLTTREAAVQMHRVLADDGVYVLNVIDHGRLDFARAEVATLRTVFDEIAVLGERADLSPAGERNGDGGNFVVLAADRGVDLAAVRKRLDARDADWSAIDGDELDAWVGESTVLTDDHAPVDQLLTPYPSRAASTPDR